MVDGHPFSGKSSLAKLLNVELDGIHIETDNFLLEHRTKDEAYPVVPGSSIFSGWPISTA
jgi:adenylate kinase family enzyme